MQTSNMIDAALLLPKLLAQTGNVPELRDAAAKIAWKRAAGEGLRRHAVPLRLRDKALIVAVADAVWQKQLQAMSAELIFRINKLLGKAVIAAIDFQINPAAVKETGSTSDRPRTRDSAQALPANVVSSAAAIDDPDLRQRFIRAAANCIDRRDTIVNAKSAIRNSKFEI